MQKLFHNKTLLIVLCSLLVILSVLYMSYGLYVPSDCDGYYRWQESAYVLRGINPFSVASGATAPQQDIGALHTDGGNMPWTYLLSNVIYPGFLPYRSALIWARFLFVILLFLAIVRVWRLTKKIWGASALQSVALVSVLFASYMWFATLRLGNHAAYIMLLLILLFTFDHRRYWYVSGLLYAFLLMKPQTAALFLLLFLLEKKWKPILFAGGILAVVVLITSVLIKTSPIAMFTDVYRLCVSYEHFDNYIYYGLLDPLVSVFHIRSAIVLPIGIFLGIGGVIFYWFYFRLSSKPVHYAVVSLLSMCWMYIQPSDMIVLGFVGFACLYMLFFTRLSQWRVFWIAFGSVLGAIPILGVFYMAGPILPLVVRLLYFVVIAALISASRHSPSLSYDHLPDHVSP